MAYPMRLRSFRDRLTSAGIALTAALVLAAPDTATAGGTRSFDVGTFDDFDKGETEGAAIEASGKVTVGYLPERGDVAGTTVFSCVATSKAALVGTADEAAIHRVFPAKARSRKGKGKGALATERLAQLDGVVVSAMEVLPGGDVLAATLPGGTIHRVDARGRVSKFAELKVDQIWAMTVHGGRLLVGTGPRGELWSLSLTGKDAKVILDADEKDILSLVTVGDAVVVGTAPRARLYQVTDDLEGVLLHDFDGDEIRALALTDTGLLAAVNKFENRQITSLDALTKTLNRTSLVGQPPSGTLVNEQPPNAEASLHHVDLGKGRDLARASEAPWESWLERKKQYFTSLLPLGKDAVLVASSAGGKVYRVRGPRDVATVADLEERQTTDLCRLPTGEVFATTAHGAAVYQLRSAPASEARYRSDVFDAKQPASWGTITVRGEGALTVRARVGPSEEPDKRWSDWQSIKLTKSATGLRGSLASMPGRRYLQVEVTLDTPRSELRGLAVFYAPENLAPLIKSVDVELPKFQIDDDTEPKPNAKIKWKVDARDDDDLAYDVRVRPEGAGESQWIRLHEDELINKKELDWDLTTVPDGVYEIGVKASDEPSNGTARARTDELVSDPVVVDRGRPVISGVVVDGSRIRATAADNGGYVHDVAFSIDGGQFRAASPTDGLFDEPNEEFTAELPASLGPGPHRVVIRARDSFGNIGTLAVVVER